MTDGVNVDSWNMRNVKLIDWYDISGGKPEKTGPQKVWKQVRRRLPILGWIKNHTKKDYVSDLIAGTTVG